MLALGVPSGPIPAVMLAAMMVHGVSPGPLLIQQQPALFWGFIASMYVGNVVLLILNLPLVGLFVNILRVPYPYLYPAILVFSILGVYAVNGSVVDVWIMLLMGVLGWVLRKLDFETAPIVLGVVLAPMIELSLRQSLAMSDGHYGSSSAPDRGVLLAVGAALVLMNLYSFVRPRPGLARAPGAGREGRRGPMTRRRLLAARRRPRPGPAAGRGRAGAHIPRGRSRWWRRSRRAAWPT